MGLAVDGRLRDRRVRKEHRLDLQRVHVHASGDDRVVLSAVEEEVAVVVDVAEVADREALAPPRRSRLPAIPPILEALARGFLDPHLTDVVGRDRGAVLGRDRDLGARDGLADASGLSQPLLGGDASRLTLGRSVELPQRARGKELDGKTLRVLAYRCSGVRDEPQGRHVVARLCL
jgi:hypothetical protein